MGLMAAGLLSEEMLKELLLVWFSRYSTLQSLGLGFASGSPSEETLKELLQIWFPHFSSLQNLGVGFKT